MVWKYILKENINIIKKLRSSQSKLLFARPGTNMSMSSNAINKKLRKILQDSQIKYSKIIPFHGVLHSHITYLLANHANIQYILNKLDIILLPLH